MTRFEYEGRSLSGVKCEGVINAPDKESAIQLLVRRDIVPTKLCECAEPKEPSGQATPTKNPIRTKPQLDSAALYSFVTSLLGILLLVGPIGSLLGVLLGHKARKRLNESGCERRGARLASAGLIVGYIGLFLFLAGVLFDPGFIRGWIRYLAAIGSVVLFFLFLGVVGLLLYRGVKDFGVLGIPLALLWLVMMSLGIKAVFSGELLVGLFMSGSGCSLVVLAYAARTLLGRLIGSGLRKGPPTQAQMDRYQILQERGSEQLEEQRMMDR
jgi:hypothetical protein